MFYILFNMFVYMIHLNERRQWLYGCYSKNIFLLFEYNICVTFEFYMIDNDFMFLCLNSKYLPYYGQILSQLQQKIFTLSM